MAMMAMQMCIRDSVAVAHGVHLGSAEEADIQPAAVVEVKLADHAGDELGIVRAAEGRAGCRHSAYLPCLDRRCV